MDSSFVGSVFFVFSDTAAYKLSRFTCCRASTVHLIMHTTVRLTPRKQWLRLLHSTTLIFVKMVDFSANDAVSVAQPKLQIYTEPSFAKALETRTP